MLILARLILPKGEDGFPAAQQAARNAGATGGTLQARGAVKRVGPLWARPSGRPAPSSRCKRSGTSKNAVARGASRPRKDPRLKCVGFILDHADTPAFCLLLNRGFVAEMSCVLDPSQGTPHILMYDPLHYNREAFQAAIACVGRRSAPLSPAPGGVASCNHLAGSHSRHYRLHHEPLRGRSQPRWEPFRAAITCVGRRSGPRSPAPGAAPGRPYLPCRAKNARVRSSRGSPST